MCSAPGICGAGGMSISGMPLSLGVRCAGSGTAAANVQTENGSGYLETGNSEVSMTIALHHPSTRTSTQAGRRLALFALCGVLFLTFLDTTIASVALGNIQSDLHAGVIQLQWVVNSYALVFASLMLMAGAIADRAGRHGVLFMGV